MSRPSHSPLMVLGCRRVTPALLAPVCVWCSFYESPRGLPCASRGSGAGSAAFAWACVSRASSRLRILWRALRMSCSSSARAGSALWALSGPLAGPPGGVWLDCLMGRLTGGKNQSPKCFKGGGRRFRRRRQTREGRVLPHRRLGPHAAPAPRPRQRASPYPTRINAPSRTPR